MVARRVDCSPAPLKISPEAAGAVSVDETLNLRGVKCPINFVKIKLKLEEMQDGRSLDVVVDAGEPMQSVPRMIKQEGHKIIRVQKTADESYSLLITKGGCAVNGG